MIDPNQVVPAPSRVRQNAAIKQNHRNVGSFQGRYNAMIGLIIYGSPFKGSKKDSGHLLCDVLLAELPGLFFFGLRIRSDIAPEKRIFSRLRRLRHTLANGSENLGISKVGNQ